MGGALAFLLVGKVRCLQNVFAFIIEDEVSSFGEAALVRAKHDVVGRRVTESREVLQL